jgi:hypothetical protein
LKGRCCVISHLIGVVQIIVFLVTLASIFSDAQEKKFQVVPVQVHFIKSPYADYLFYLLYRSTGQFPELETTVPLGKIPTIDQLISLPEQAASSQAKSYRDLDPLLEQYQGATKAIVDKSDAKTKRFRKLAYSDDLPPYQQLNEIVHQGEASYPAFQQFWGTKIAPVEQQQIDIWQHQLEECSPISKLQELERLSFPFATLDVASIALHLSGSGNTDPAGLYTGVFKKPNLAWVVGHEATHLMVDRYAGHQWTSYPRANEAIDLVKRHDGTANDIEESLSLFMQVTLSQSCGYTEASRRISDKFPATTPTGAILRSLESGWSKYQADRTQDIIDYLIEQTIDAFSPAAPKPVSPSKASGEKVESGQH